MANNLAFYKDFDSALLMNVTAEIYVRKVSLPDYQIASDAWNFIYYKFLELYPVRTDIYYAIKKEIPKDVEASLFGKLSIEKVCCDMRINRHNFNYQAKKYTQPLQMPTFQELIDEVINDK